MIAESIGENVFTENLVGEIADCILDSPDFDWRQTEEVRLRVGRPVYVRCAQRQYIVKKQGKPLVAEHAMVERSVVLFAKSSFYAFEEEMRQGFITVKGGHRMGLCGETVLENGQIKTLKNISSINFRVAREIYGAADAVLPYIWDGGRLRQTLLVAPPAVGKTTVLRDLARKFGDGEDVPVFNVGIADERCEIAASFLGTPQMNIGACSDVISGCSKADGIMMLIRSMAPDLVLTDEIGRKSDAAALRDAMNCGVKVIATAHGADYGEIQKRPVVKDLLRDGFFERVIVLARGRRGVYPKAVYGEEGEKLC